MPPPRLSAVGFEVAQPLMPVVLKLPHSPRARTLAAPPMHGKLPPHSAKGSLYSSTRALLLSATNRLPEASTATPVGWFRLDALTPPLFCELERKWAGRLPGRRATPLLKLAESSQPEHAVIIEVGNIKMVRDTARINRRPSLRRRTIRCSAGLCLSHRPGWEHCG